MRRSDDELMLAYAGGDQGALAELFRRYAPVLLERLRGDGALTRETFVQLHRARRDFRRGMSVGAWIATIAANLASEGARR